MDKKIKEKVSQTLGISTATVENWEKAGLIPGTAQKNLLADEAAYINFVQQIRKNTQNRLKTRANRTSSSEKFTVFQGQKDPARRKLLERLIEIGQAWDVEAAVVGAAVRQLECCGLLVERSRVWESCRVWVDKAAQKSGLSGEKIRHLFDGVAISACNDDILGALYQSLQSLGQKAGGGSFYTPVQALEGIQIESGQTVYDPCCGSGNILLNILSPSHDSSLIYASDVDETALIICETNLVLFFNDPNMRATVFKRSFIEPQSDDVLYDVIVTNPPWGAHFSALEKKRLKLMYPQLQTSESFSICLYNALRLLGKNGILFFFLPQAFANVATHSNIRQFLLHRPGHLALRPLGSIFSGVFSKCVLLEFTAGAGGAAGGSEEGPHGSEEKLYGSEETPCILSDGLYVYEPDCVISMESKEEHALIEKLYALPHTTLKDNAKFFLGIVTGSNETFVSTTLSALKNAEPVYRGKNIIPYLLTPSTPPEYISFCPEKFQQCASPDLFRQRKIVYRFIYDRPVCAISEAGELMLNSANCFIPTLDYPWETIVALFNSDIYATLYQKKYSSLKLLRSHIESFPLPFFTPSQHAQIKTLYTKIKSAPNPETLFYQMTTLLKTIIDH